MAIGGYSEDQVAATPSGRSRAALSRRNLLAVGVASGVVAAAAPVAGASGLASTSPRITPSTTGSWLGPELWGNRLGDWAATADEWSCVAAEGARTLCTASVLTRRLTGGSAVLRVRVTPDRPGQGLAGLAIGTGLDEDFRRTALVGTSAGTGGGILAVIGDDGALSFRDHTSETAQFAYRRLSSSRSGARGPIAAGEPVDLTVECTPTSGSRVTLTLSVIALDGSQISSVTRRGVDRAAVTGGVALVSGAGSPRGPLWSFGNLSLSGPGVEVLPEQAFGSIIGTLFSISGGVLKMTAQVAPFDRARGDRVVLETQASDGSWQRRASAPVGTGYVAALRVAGWATAAPAPYRVRHTRVAGTWGGTIPAEPAGDRPVRIATMSCCRATQRPFDLALGLDGGLAGGDPLPLYSSANLWFPYEDTVPVVAGQHPDVLVAMGDQFYEDSPTQEDLAPTPELDFLYKYLQWLWSVRELTKDVPTLVLVDDHDVFQGNLWGEGGIPAPGGDQNRGGFEKRAGFVNLVQRVQCGHNPDPIDPEPVAQGINVYFTRFDYAGITFVILEDRKFKTAPKGVVGHPDAPFELLGSRQEAMLAQLASDKQAVPGPTVVLTQTVYASVQTTADGQMTSHRDSNGFPKPARDRALTSIKAAGAVMLSGDTHLASLVQHLDLPGGPGPVQFTGPALASAFQRWFEPDRALPGAHGTPHTGIATDLLGNRFDVVAVANPSISEVDVDRRSDVHSIGQRSLKKEGYGLCVVDFTARTYRFEAWPGGVDPAAPGAAPYPGWPWSVGFDEA